jgi:hypothetical protein
MAEPLPPLPASPVTTAPSERLAALPPAAPPTSPFVVARTAAEPTAAEPTAAGAAAAEPAGHDDADVAGDWDEAVDELDELDDGDGISVPPLEPIGSMSRAASRALFGD